MILGGTVVESMSLDARQACFQHWASRFALSLNVLIYEDNGMFATGCWKRKWSYIGAVLNIGPGMYSILCKWKLLSMRSITLFVVILCSLMGPSGLHLIPAWTLWELFPFMAPKLDSSPLFKEHRVH